MSTAKQSRALVLQCIVVRFRRRSYDVTIIVCVRAAVVVIVVVDIPDVASHSSRFRGLTRFTISGTTHEQTRRRNSDATSAISVNDVVVVGVEVVRRRRRLASGGTGGNIIPLRLALFPVK